MDNLPFRGSRAVQVNINIRCGKEMSYQTLAAILQGEIPYIEEHLPYLLTFFEECSPNLMRLFMEEQGISRDSIVNMYKKLSTHGETCKFGRALENGSF